MLCNYAGRPMAAKGGRHMAIAQFRIWTMGVCTLSPCKTSARVRFNSIVHGVELHLIIYTLAGPLCNRRELAYANRFIALALPT